MNQQRDDYKGLGFIESGAYGRGGSEQEGFLKLPQLSILHFAHRLNHGLEAIGVPDVQLLNEEIQLIVADECSVGLVEISCKHIFNLYRLNLPILIAAEQPHLRGSSSEWMFCSGKFPSTHTTTVGWVSRNFAYSLSHDSILWMGLSNSYCPYAVNYRYFVRPEDAVNLNK